ncbi:MAG TPA: hypothetical protein VFU76_07795 [Terriglobales bacterium]|nr:hypothetical protein [Terriglobales bacterium]
MADASAITLTPPPSKMDGMAQIAGVIPKGDILKPLAEQEVAQGEQLQQHMDEDEAQLSHLDQAQQANWQMMQRQRLITVNKAQVLRKVLPVIGLFTLIAGKAEGLDGALAALGGGMAGLTKGMDQNMQDAWKQYTVHYNQMMARVKETQAQIKAVIDDRDKTQAQKTDLYKALGSQVASYRLALSRAASDQSRMQAAQLRASTEAADTAAHDATQLAVANTHAEVERQARIVAQQKHLADVALKAPTVGDMKVALGALFGAPKGGAAIAAPTGDPLLGGGKVDPFAGYDTMQQGEARQLLSQTAVYQAQHPDVPRDVAMQRVQADLFRQGLSNVSSLKLPHERAAAAGGKTVTMAGVRKYVAAHPGQSQDQVIAELKAKGYVVVP